MIEGPIQTNNSGLVFYFDAKEPKSYVGEPTTNIWSVQIGASINNYNSWGTPNAGTASITSTVVTNYGSWNGNRIWLVSVGSGTLVSYGSWRLCVDQPTAGSAYSSTRRLAAKIRMLTGSITNIGLHSGGGTGGHNASDFTSILEKNVPLDCSIKDGWTQMLSDAGWSSTTVAHCVGVGLNNSGPYSFLVTEPMYYPSNRLVNFTPTSRSNAQGLLDLVGGSTIDLTNASFDGNSNILFASNKVITATMTNLRPTSQITQECWFSTTSNIAQVFIGAQYGSSSNNSYAVWMDGANSLAAGVNIGGSFNYSTQAYTITTNQYYHFVHTYDGSTQAMYMNGVLVKSFATSGTITYDATNNTLLAIGNDWNSGYNSGASIGVIGYLPVVRIYNRALSAAEILNNFNSQRSRYNV